MTRLEPGRAMDAARLPVAFDAVPADQVISGAPATRYLDVDEASGRTVGVWEHTPGVSTDVEVDEVFVVLAGDATIEFEGDELPALELRPGSIVRLAEGMRTTWTVHETLRKVYVVP